MCPGANVRGRPPRAASSSKEILPCQTSARHSTDSARYASASKRPSASRWDTERDVIRGRPSTSARPFCPTAFVARGATLCLTADEAPVLAGAGPHHANMFALVGAIHRRQRCWRSSRATGSSAIRWRWKRWCALTDEGLKHQGDVPPPGDDDGAGMPRLPVPAAANDVAQAVLAASWAVLALVCDIELFSQAHTAATSGPRRRSTRCGRDVFLFHWKEVAARDPRDGVAARDKIDSAQRDQAGERNSSAWWGPWTASAGCRPTPTLRQGRGRAFDAAGAGGDCGRDALAAYRWQYIDSGCQDPRFQELLGSMIDAPARLADPEAWQPSPAPCAPAAHRGATSHEDFQPLGVSSRHGGDDGPTHAARWSSWATAP